MRNVSEINKKWLWNNYKLKKFGSEQLISNAITYLLVSRARKLLKNNKEVGEKCM